MARWVAESDTPHHLIKSKENWQKTCNREILAIVGCSRRGARVLVVATIAALGADATPAVAKGGGVKSAAAAATTARSTRTKRVIAGFRMEGDPAIEMVFGDTDRYKALVDRFYELHEQMRDVRSDFSRFVRAAQTTLSAHKRKCPEDAVAPLYTQAHTEGRRYRRLGSELESHYSAIRNLDKLGETSGLTPDYRWRVKRIRRHYKAALIDYREMRAVFDEQLSSELDFHRCNAKRLLALGAEAPVEPAPATAATSEPPKVDDVIEATVAAATFFIDNNSCNNTLRVYVDGMLLGDVASKSKAAFQAQPGRHSLCLLPSTSKARCGDTGTERSAYLHDGWSMSMRCE
jgi:hypothetical protein